MAANMKASCLYMLLALLVIICLCTIGDASKVSLTPRRKTQWLASKLDQESNFITQFRGGSAQRRWERMDGKTYGGLTSSNGGETGNAFQKSLESVSGNGGNGKACNFYVWDAPSALFHKWCHHLLKDCVYEGLGGRKFVRIEPGSILQLLYPCSRYSPDRCVVCGGTFRDHLTLWWAKHLYTPFDRHLDRVYAAGVKLEPTFPLVATTPSSPRPKRRPKQYRYSRNRKRPKYNPPKKNAPVEMTKLFAFHHQYVLDVHTLIDSGIKDKNERKKKLHKDLTKMQSKAGTPLEVRILTDRKVSYVVPALRYPASHKDNDATKGQPPSVLLQIARATVLNTLDNLITVQEIENERIRLKKRKDACCH